MSAGGKIFKMSKEFSNEINSNVEIIQVIKAADQLYYTDKTLYTAIKPELIRSDKDRSKDVEKHQKIEKEQGDGSSGKMIADNVKPNNQQGEKSNSNKNSKLQEMIGQAKKTVEEALGSSYGSLECQQDKNREVANINTKGEDLVKFLNALEQRLRAVEELTKGIANKIGYSK